MLNSKLTSQLKQKLEDKKQDVTKELMSFANKTNPSTEGFDTVFPNYGEHEDENAQEITTYENNLPLEHTLETDLAKINKALKKIEEGTYGICEKCGESIDPKRLEAYPEAETCIKCASN